MRVLVTGAAGYIGGAIARTLAASGHEVHGAVRRETALPAEIVPEVTGDLADAELTLHGFGAIVHAAGLGHRRGVKPDVWRRANVDAAVNVARQAKAAGVGRLLLISTAHVHGRTYDGVVRDGTPPNPMDGYAESKLEAEAAVTAAFGVGVKILRPVAVIGPGCPGNLQLVMKLLAKGAPLPFGGIANARSFIEVGDLARLAAIVLASYAPPKVVLAASPEAIATPELVKALARGMGVAARLPKLPPALLGSGAFALGRGAMWQSLSGSFIADPWAALQLGWSPAKPLSESLEETGRYFVVS